MRHIGIACCAFVIFAMASASAAEFPARKAGLWEITIAGPRPVKMRQCSDAATDQAAQAGMGLSGECSKRDVQTSGSSITIDSVCKAAGKTTTSHIVITGSLESKYTMIMTSQTPGSRSAGAPMTLNAEWLGPCQAYQKPGELIMPDGTKVNLSRAAGR